MPDGTQNTEGLIVTDSCAARIAKLREIQGNDALKLRVTVNGGGCSGFQYAFDLDDKAQDDDITFEHNGAEVVTDEVSLGFLAGCTVEFKDELGAAFFSIDNPNATSSCGCGASFSV
ncbi:MAG: iron-sulfur cluster insertion protein ErpA [Rhodospirillales bacterium]|nr:iron-sulfur cluster insertion protein ErpA [Rhodospirillales bacterium]MBO6786473.1 iron-sulfur cluster insertion protein ErpA [Rhodospirillales bacterium]